jgi:lysophospholipase L1-like esterase
MDRSSSGSSRRFALGPRGWLFTVLALVVVTELALRGFGYGREAGSMASEHYGWRMVGGRDRVDPKTGLRVTTNAQGFRDREWASPPVDEHGAAVRDAELLRIAWLGNSNMWGGGDVPVELRCDRLVEGRVARELERRGDPRRVLTMNFAQPGYTFEQMARLWEDVVRPYRPDVLIVPLCCYDIRPMRPSFERSHYPLRRMIESSALFDLYKTTLGGGWHAQDAASVKVVEVAVEVDPFAAELRELQTQLERRLAEVHDQARADGTRMIVVALPVLDDFFDAERPWIGATWKTWCESRGVDFVDPLPRFRGAMQPLLDTLEERGITRGEVFAHDWTSVDGVQLPGAADTCFWFLDPDHYTRRGHRMIAESLVGTLLDAPSR